MEIEEVTISAPSRKKTKNICNKCSKKVKVYFTCSKCRNIYHAKCVLKAPTVYVNEEGHIFCCLNITSNSIESKLQTHENGKSIEEDVCGSDDGLENSSLDQEEHEDDDIYDAQLEKGEILEEVDRDKVDFVCSFCEVKFFEDKSYKQHRELCEENYLRLNKTQDAAIMFEKIHKCDKCSYTTKCEGLLRKHSDIHLCGKPFKCTFKSCKCTQSPDTPQVKQCDCSMCEFTTSSKGYLQKHILRNHCNKGRKYKCDSCTYSTPVKGYIMQHLLVHLNEKSFKCDTCDFKTVYKKNLSSHILIKHSNIEKQYKCNDCNFSTHTKTSLSSHIRNTHSDDNPFKCIECEFATIFKSRLQRHVYMHSKKKQFK